MLKLSTALLSGRKFSVSALGHVVRRYIVGNVLTIPIHVIPTRVCCLARFEFSHGAHTARFPRTSLHKNQTTTSHLRHIFHLTFPSDNRFF
jgi:hypothetical protein